MDFELRKLQSSDTKSIAKYANNNNIAHNVRNIFPHPYTVEDARTFINECKNNDEKHQCIRAIVVNQEAIGVIGCFIKDDVHCKCCEIGYWLGEEFWGKGIMTEALTRMCREVFQSYDVVRIFAETFSYNAGSSKVLENAGFQLEGKLRNSIYKNGKVSDSFIYAIIRQCT